MQEAAQNLCHRMCVETGIAQLLHFEGDHCYWYWYNLGNLLLSLEG